MSVGTMAALVLVAVAVSALVINFGMVQAAGGDAKASIKADLKIKQKGTDVDVKVKAKGLDSDKSFTVRAYSSSVTNCGAGPAAAIGPVTSDDKGKLKISGTISDKVVDDIGSVSIRITGSPGSNPPVVCFQNTTP